MGWDLLDPSTQAFILSLLPVPDRIGSPRSCALVSSSFRKAAAAATGALHLQRCADAGSLQAWLDSHGSSLKKVQFEGTFVEELSRLPHAELQELLLQDCTLQAGKGQQLMHSVQAATKLTHISLSVVDSNVCQPDWVSVLSPLTGLQRLCLDSSSNPVPGYRDVAHNVVPAGLLQQLPQLTHLQLGGIFYSDCLSGLECLSCVQHLQLLFSHKSVCTDSALAGLPSLQHLTALSILADEEWYEGQDNRGNRVLGGLPDMRHISACSKLTSLLQLSLAWEVSTGLQPGEIAALSQLTKLELSGDYWRHTSWHAGAIVGGKVSKGAEDLVAVLPKLEQLQVLHLSCFGLQACSDAAWARVAASSSLRTLELRHCHFAKREYVFSAPGSWPFLRSLCLDYCVPDMDPVHPVVENASGCITAACTGLQQLSLGRKTSRAMMHCEQQLLGMSALSTLAVAVGSDAECRVLAQLTSLKSLGLLCRPAVPAEFAREGNSGGGLTLQGVRHSHN